MSDGSDVTLRGYAVAFNLCGWVGSDAEIMDWHAFDVQLAGRSPQVYLNFNSHDDLPLSKGVSIFSDRYGLGFEAKVDLREWTRLCRPMAAFHNKCSINMTCRLAKPERLSDGTAAERVTRATIDHICVVDSPCHPATAIWAMIDGEPPPRFRELNQQWRKGWNEFVALDRPCR
jgi:phage head maturation protease